MSAFDLTKLIGFNFSGLEVDQVAIDTAADDIQAGYSPLPTDYVPGTTTYTVLGGASGNTGFSGNDADPGTGTAYENKVFETITAATNGKTIDGTPLGQTDPTTGVSTNPLALGQIADAVTVNGNTQAPVTYDVLGYSTDGSTILVGLASTYNPATPDDPYGGQYYLLSDTNIDGNATPPLFPDSNIVFTTTNSYVGAPVSAGGVAADLVTVTTLLTGAKVNGATGFVLTNTQNGSAGVTLNTDGSITVTTTSNKITLPAGTLTQAPASAGSGAEGQPTLVYNNSISPEYFQVIGFNATQVLLLQVTSKGVATSGPTYAVLSTSLNSPAQNAAVSLTFNDFGRAPVLSAAAPCFLRGTRIATPEGSVAVENLREGDSLVTITGEIRKVVWVGNTRIDISRHADPTQVKPVQIKTGAFGNGTPQRDLFLSPDHAVFVDDLLIPVKHLLNGTTIRQVDRRIVEYFHVELEQHDVVFAEGLPAETYLDTGNRAALQGVTLRSGGLDNDAGLNYVIWESLGYRPLTVSGDRVDALRARLAEFATVCRQPVAA